MKRAIFPKGEQEIWINELLERSNTTAKNLAVSISVHPRTFSDWKRGKVSLPVNILDQLCTKFSSHKPDNIKVVPQYWYVNKGARIGALRRLELYGPLGTPEGRRKGGIVSQQRRRENPEKYRLLGCNLKKDFSFLKKSEEFAETVGIILGDGGITDTQVTVTLDSKTDKDYASFVMGLFKSTLKEMPSYYKRRRDNAVDIRISGTGLVEELRKYGLDKGDKIYRQVDFPQWIWEKVKFQKACVRGLMDTDGSVYSYRPKPRGKLYEHLAMCFTSYSRPMITSVSNVLSNQQIRHTLNKHRLNIYSLAAIKRYFDIVGTNNPKHENKYLRHCQLKIG